MSTAIRAPLTPTQRRDEAARLAAVHLGVDDVKAVAAALAEAAIEGIKRNPSFEAQVRTLYTQMARAPKVKRANTQRVRPDVELVPRKYIAAPAPNVGAAPDPYYLLDLYEADQLPLALSRYSLTDLRLAAELVQQKNPGTKPKSKSSRAAIIEYIVLLLTS
jgi:hypothetical protein